MNTITSGLTAVSLVLAGTFGAALNELPARIAWFGIAMTLCVTILAIGMSLGRRERPTTCSHQAELEQARKIITTVRALHAARIRACASCPTCQPDMSHTERG